MLDITKEQLKLAKKAMNQINAQINKLCVDVLGLVEIINILNKVEKELK